MSQFHGFYDKSTHRFDCKSANLIVPVFGPISLASNVVFDLKNSAYVLVDLGKAAKGKFKIEYGVNDSQVVVNYDLKLAFVSSKLKDIIPLFPTFGIFSSYLKLYVAHLFQLEIRLPSTR